MTNKEVLETLKSNGNDVDGALRRFVGSESMYVKFLKRFIDDTSYPALKDAVEKGDLGNAFVAVHTLKGVAGNLGLTKVYDVACAMTEKLRIRSDENLQGDFAQLTAEYDAAVELIAQLG